MTQLQDVALALGGVGKTFEFRNHGFGAGVLYSAAGRGELVRVRKGWYAHPGIGDAAMRATRVGGALACVSAARHHGLWVPGDDELLHVAVRSHAVRLRSAGDRTIRLVDRPDGVVVHWLPSVPRVVQSVTDAILCAAACRGDECAFIVAESGLHLGRLAPGDVADIATRGTRSLRRLIGLAGRRSESGTESMLKLVLEALGLRYRQQVEISGVGRVDFVVGDRLVIEVDSRAHHPDALADRRRDAALSARGYRVLRFMYSQIVFDRQAVVDAILGAVVRGDAR